MTLLLQSAVFIVVTLGGLLLLAGTLSRFGGVGVMELWLLLGPALIAGLWMARRVGRIARPGVGTQSSTTVLRHVR